MAANSKQPKRESRAQRRQEEQARVQAKRERLQKERRTQTIIGIVVTSTYYPLPCFYISAIIFLALNIILGKGLYIFVGRLRKSER